jgi:hypothetical protein
MANVKVTVKGTGQLNGTVPINKTVEMDERAARAFSGAKRDRAIEAFVETHFPGVSINPKKFSANISAPARKSKQDSSSSNGLNGALFGSVVGGAIAAGVTAARNRKKDSRVEITDDFTRSLEPLIQLSFQGDVQDTIKKLDHISVQTTGFKWELSPDSGIGKQNNRMLNQCLELYKNGVKRLAELDADEILIQRYKKKLKWMQGKRMLNYIGLYLLVLGVIAVLWILILLL